MKTTSRSIMRANNKRRHTIARTGAFMLGLFLGISFEVALADPSGGRVIRGEGSIGQSGATTTISQQTQRLLLEWQSFNVAANENVIFDQPGATAVALNRILDQNASEILGAIDANGRVFLLNPNGIIFGETATVNVGALVASSLDIDYDDFMAGNYNFQTLADGTPGVVVNRGLLQAATGGSVTLMGGAVSNEGLILAELGQVTLAAGGSASLDFDGDGLLFFEVDGDVLASTGVLDSAVSNTGEIEAQGGEVLLTARVARDVLSNVVNNEGIIRAQRIDNTGGVIRLVGSGGNTLSNGVVDASAGDTQSTGGHIQILGDRVGLVGNAVVDASGAAGGGEIKIGGGFQGNDPTVRNASRTLVGQDASIAADAGTTGDGGEVIVWADDWTLFYGDISARGGSDGGAGGFAEISGKRSLTFAGTANLGGGTLLLDPDSITIQAADPDINGDTTTGDDLANLTDLDDAALDFPGADSVITNTAVNGLLTGADTLVLAADTNVDVNAAITGSDNANLTLTAPTVNLNDTITLAGAGVLSSGLGSPTTVNVGTNGLIQNGIDLSTTNGTVNVAAGTFDEQLNIPVAGLTLSGNGTDVAGGTATIVQSTAVPAPGVFDVEIDTIDVTVEDFVFDFNGFAAVAGDGEDLALGSRGGQGIVVSDLAGPVATGVTIQNNEIYTGDGSGLGGTAIQTGKNADVTGLLIAGNTIHGDADGLGEGIYVNPQAGVGGVTISGNTIDGALFSGVSIESGNVTVSNNAIAHTETGTFAQGSFGIRFIELEPVLTPNYANVSIGGVLPADGNTISGFQNGIRVGNDDAAGSTLTASLQNNTIQNNSIGIDLMSGAAVAGLGNTYTGNTTDLDIDTAEDAGDGAADDFNVILNGANVEFRVNGSLVFSEVSADLNDATLTGSGDDDTLTADFSGGNPLPTGGIVFNAGGQTTGDTLVLSSGTVASVTHSFTNANDGSVTVDGPAIAYTGLEPITDNLDATTRVFTFTGGAETIDLDDDAVANDNVSTIDSTLGESVTFTNPTDSLTVNAGSGADTINLNDLDALFTASLTVNGDALADTVNLIDLPGTVSALTLNAESIDISAASVTTTGTQTYGGAVTLVSSTALSTGAAAGDILFNDTVNGNFDLALNSGTGGVTLGAVGQSTALASLDVNGTGQTNLGGDITTQGAGGIALDGATDVDLTANVTLDGGGAGPVDVSGGAVDGNFDLVVNNGAGAVTLGAVGQNTALASLDVNGTGQTNLGGNITTQGAGGIALDGATDVDVTANVTLDGGGAGPVDVSGGAVDGNFDLVVNNGAGAVTLGAVGQNTALASLNVAGSGIDLQGNISTTGASGVTVSSNGSVVAQGNIAAGAGPINISIDVDEATDPGVESLEIQGSLSAATINLDGTGTTQDDTLIVSLTAGDSADWIVNGGNAGTLSTSISGDANFTNFSSLTGGAQVDTFNLVGGTLAGEVDGAGGSSDELVGDNVVNTFDITGTDSGNATGVGSFVNIENLTGNADADTFTFTAALTGTASGEGEDDTFNIIDGGDENQSIDGGADGANGDEVSYAGRSTGVTVDMADINAVENIAGSGFDDTFNLNGDEGNDINIDGQAGTDDFFVVSDSQIAGDLSISNVESVASANEARLSANLLSIADATSGIGSEGAGNELNISVDEVLIIGAGGVYLEEVDALSSLSVDSSADVAVETGAEMVVILVSTTNPDGTVTLEAVTGNIVNGNGDADIESPEISGDVVTLIAEGGFIGNETSPITIEATNKRPIATIFINALGGVILNPNLAVVDATSAGLRDASTTGTAAATSASVLSALEEIGFIDWAGLDPDVKIFDWQQPAIKLPPDQLDEGLAGVREPAEILVIRTLHGTKLIPVFVQPSAWRMPSHP